MLISADRLTEVVRAIIAHASGNEEAAKTVAHHLVDANLAGHDSHGVGVLPQYMNGLKAGNLKADGVATLVEKKGPYLLVDGNRGFGQVIAKQAMEWAIETARENHIAVLSLKNSFHIGRIGAWGEMAARAGFVSLHWVNVLSPNSLVAPFGGSAPRFATNPHVTAVPATPGNPMFVLDMATSTIAQGKARVAYAKGVEVPDNCLIDHEGRPTNDPAVMFEEPRGAMTTTGLHKGYGLAVACEFLAGAFSGGGTHLPSRVEENKVVNNMMAILLDPNIFGHGEAFAQDVDAFTDWVKSSKPAPGVDAVMVAGDPERKARADRSANGIPIDDGSWGQILETADMVGFGREAAERIANGG